MKANETNVDVLKAKEVLWPAEAAVLLGVSSETIRRWVRDGKLQAIKGPSKFRKFAMTEIQRLLDSCK